MGGRSYQLPDFSFQRGHLGIGWIMRIDDVIKKRGWMRLRRVVFWGYRLPSPPVTQPKAAALLRRNDGLGGAKDEWGRGGDATLVL